jgi:hypothetical protein
MKIIILLEPPYSIISLELEEIAQSQKFTYFSLSDVYPSETGGESEIAKQMKTFETRQEAQSYVFSAILKKHLKNPPKNGPNGFVLDPDCIESPKEIEILLDILAEMGQPAPIVVDIQTSLEECMENVAEMSWDEAAAAEVSAYFDVQYDLFLGTFKAKGLTIVDFDVEMDEKGLSKQFLEILR